IARLDTARPPGRVVVCLDERGPESAKSFAGQPLVPAGPKREILPTEPQSETVATTPEPGVEPPVTGPPVGLSGDAAAPGPGVEPPPPQAERAKQEIDYGRRGTGSLFGAFRPATGEALTHPDPSRRTANWAAFLGRVEAWIPSEVERVYALVDHRNA